MSPLLSRIAAHLKSMRQVSEFSPLEVDPDLLPHLFVIDIERAGGETKLKVRLVGTALDAAFHRPTAGHYLEEFVHGPRGHEVIREFHNCASSRRPVWMRQIVRIGDQVPRFVEGVAFSRAGAAVWRIGDGRNADSGTGSGL